MEYPRLLREFNKVLGYIAGAMVLFIAFLSSLQGVMNGLFSKPIPWSLEVSQYMLVWIIFLASPWAFQDKKHTSVDFLLVSIAERWGIGARRVLTLLGYAWVLVYLCVLLWGSINMIRDAFELSRLTMGIVQIHINYLYFALLVGTVVMLVTVVCIVMDLLRGGTEYL